MKRNKRETLIQAARIGLVIIMVCSMFAASPAAPVKAASTTFFVGPDGDYQTISAAVLNAPPNTVIYVQPGNYFDVIDLTRMGDFTPEGARQGNLAIIALDGATPDERVVWAGSGIKLHSNNLPFNGSIWLDGVSMSSNNNSVISLKDFNGLMLTDVTIESSGSTASGTTDAISLNLTSGTRTVALYHTAVNNFVRDGLDVQVSGSANVNVVVEGSVFKTTNGAYHSLKAVDVYATGTSTAQLTVYETEINGMFNSAISAVADGATPVKLGVHVHKNAKIANVAKDPGTNAIEVRAKGAGAHTVDSWFYNNTISMPKHSDGIELEPAAPGSFSSIFQVTQIEASAGLDTPVGRGIVIDNNGATAATTGNFKFEGNSVKNTPGSAIDLHLVTTNQVTWYGLFTNNTFASVNTAMPNNQESLHFKVQGASLKPIFYMLFTGNNLMQNAPANTIKLENIGATFRVVSQLGSATAEFTFQNFNFVPYIYGSVPVVLDFNTTIYPNDRPQTNPDFLLTWMNNPRTQDVVENDVDTNGRMLAYVNPLGLNAGTFLLDDNDSPDSRMDDLLVYQPPDTYLGEDFTYYIVQDALGCSSIGIVNTLVVAAPLFIPVIRR